MKEKGNLNELIASIKVTCELVACVAQKLKHQESEEGKDMEITAQPTQTLDELYMETMKPLQFGKAFVKQCCSGGDIAQLVEYLLCKQEALGSIPSISVFFISILIFSYFCRHTLYSYRGRKWTKCPACTVPLCRSIGDILFCPNECNKGQKTGTGNSYPKYFPAIVSQL